MTWLTESCDSLLLPMRVQHHESIVPGNTNQGKGKNSKFKVYCFLNILKLKNFKLNHCETGSVLTLSKIPQLASGGNGASPGLSDAKLMLVTTMLSLHHQIQEEGTLKMVGNLLLVNRSIVLLKMITFFLCLSHSWETALHIEKGIDFGFKQTWSNPCCPTESCVRMTKCFNFPNCQLPNLYNEGHDVYLAR